MYKFRSADRIFFSTLGISALLGLILYYVIPGYSKYPLAGITVLLSYRIAYLASKRRYPTVEPLMLIVTIVTLGKGLYLEGLIVMFLYGLAEVIEDAVEGLAKSKIKGAEKLLPTEVKILYEGEVREFPANKLSPGDVVFVPLGGVVPADSISLDEGAVDASFVTGESSPLNVIQGDYVPSGVIVVRGPIRLRVLKPPPSSYAQKLIGEALRSLEEKPRVSRYIEKISPILTVSVVSLFVAGYLIFGAEKSISILLAGCPSAFIISSAFLSSYHIASMARYGVLVRGGTVFEKTRLIDVFILDKTGTLTKPSVKVEKSLEKYGQLLFKAVSLAATSRHPIARALGSLRHHSKYSTKQFVVEEVKEYPGVGLEGIVDGEKILIVNGPLSSCGKTIMVKGENQRIMLCVVEKIDEQSRQLVDYFKSRGIRTIIASGDRRQSVENVARALGIPEFYYGLKADEKARLVEKLVSQGFRVAFIGDGVNDSAALAKSHLSIAVGEIEFTRSLADVIAPEGTGQALKFIQTAYDFNIGIMTAFATAVLVKIIVAALGLSGIMPIPLVALFGDDGSTIAAILASLIASYPRNHSS